MQNMHSRVRLSDSPAFNASQSRQEQMYILVDMLCMYKTLWGIEAGELVDYCEVVKGEADTIPGRTRDESLDMINRAIKFIISAEEIQAEERRDLIKSLSAIILTAVGLVGFVCVVTWGMPHLAEVLSH